MDVSDVIRDRMHEPAGLSRMTVASVLAHGALFAIMIAAPGSWFGRASEAPRTVMTISFDGGTPGPESGGLTSMGARPVQAVQPPEAPREAVRAPAAKAPVMTVPERDARPLRNASPDVKQAPDDARGRTPTRGAETSEGSSIATGIRGQGFGLSTGGGTGIGGVQLDVGNFCCPDYLALMVQRIRSNWDAKTENAGDVGVRFRIARNGTLIDPVVERSSGVFVLDNNALRALVATRQLPPLPEAYTNPDLGVQITFQYRR